MSKEETLGRRRAIKRTVALGFGVGALGAMGPRLLQANTVDPEQISSNFDADLIIVGAGNAGIPAAIQAADLGFKVLLVDKNPFIGGMLNISGGHISGADSKLQIEKGIEDSPAQHYRDCMRMGKYSNNSELLKIAVENAAAMIDWLVEIGVEFTPESPAFEDDHEHYSSARTYWGPDYGRSLLGPLRLELEKRIERGDINLLLSTTVIKLLQDDAGTVTGIAVENGSGKAASYMAKAVILTTGGYGASQALKEKYNPNIAKSKVVCLPHASGDGLIMAQQAGAELINMDHFVSFPGAINGARGRLIFPPKHYSQGIWVNKKGERFINEHSMNPDERERAFLAQTDFGYFMILDNKAKMNDEIGVKGWNQQELDRQVSKGVVKKANSIRGLGRKMGIPVKPLLATVTEYNQAVFTKVDEKFNRQRLDSPINEGPFYSIPITGSILISHGGVAVNPLMQAIEPSGKIIDGLYAAGETIGSAQMMGTAVLSGMSVGPAITLGRIAARNACQYMQYQNNRVASCLITET